MIQIPHSAFPRYIDMPKRRCILTWLSRIGEDKSTLPNTGRGASTVQDITLTRIACTRPKTTPSGKPINNANIPFRFPACVRLRQLGALSDALIGLR
ncbi:2bca6c04-8f04-41e0-aee5-66ac8ece6d87 [Sclerotinia trifoliorum]|uniref:2bca6c04-8f04-41e0-aee5-66ac8ece6d87 n=1 Tax=Sclerotinia trifoliorum TaxID=28548 RepID=A0A8H2VUK0_9HELO|nr:2bca6c04-8f04-41e0-aee5-66ac8ece6d87 [Sclerotinia trifoliorum]